MSWVPLPGDLIDEGVVHGLRYYRPKCPFMVDGIEYKARVGCHVRPMLEFLPDEEMGGGYDHEPSDPPTDEELDAWVQFSEI